MPASYGSQPYDGYHPVEWLACAGMYVLIGEFRMAALDTAIAEVREYAESKGGCLR